MSDVEKPKEEQLKLGDVVRKVKVSIPKLIQDNPMVKWTTADGKWSQTTPIDTNIVRFLSGRLDAYFEITMNKAEILKMVPISEELYLSDVPQ